MHNACLPPEISQEKFLLEPQADTKSKDWDEDLLKEWERLDNRGEPWEGRQQ